MELKTFAPNLERQSLIENNLVLVKQIASRFDYLNYGETEEEELIGYGIIGLIEAAHKFEMNKGASFKSFAWNRIKGAMLDYLRSADKVTRGSRQKIKRLNSTIQELEQELNTCPTDAQIADKMQISIEELQKIQYEATTITLSLDNSIKNDSGDNLVDQITDQSLNPAESCEQKNFQENLVKQIESLPERERIVIGLYHYRQLSMKEIGNILKVSESRACQIHNRAISLLRGKLLSQI